MKLQIALCFVIPVVACNLVHAYDKDGQPGCKTQEELDIGVFRDNWDPTSYWKCEVLNEAATRIKCPSEMGYLDSVKECVNWESWNWEEPAEPISEVEDE
ncbi:uncharacterized protein [Drosophila tropicalis]|uniref:uncharacterized protein n=1 Tax=Drosophila tropicalis TaxID=46794 RepID=UPI0035AB946E